MQFKERQTTQSYLVKSVSHGINVITSEASEPRASNSLRKSLLETEKQQLQEDICKSTVENKVSNFWKIFNVTRTVQTNMNDKFVKFLVRKSRGQADDS